MNPGIYPGLKMAQYLALPAVNAGLLQDVSDRCPYAGWFQSWLNPKRPIDDGTAAQNAGTIAHGILLEGHRDRVQIFHCEEYPNLKGGGHADGWSNKMIREARDLALAEGKIPVLAEEMGRIEAMVDAARAYIDSLRTTEPAIWRLFQPGGGESELTVVWQDRDVLCRIRPDRLATDRALVVDVKTTKTSAEPDTWGRTQMMKMGFWMDAAFYRRGLAAHFGEEPDYVYLVMEQDPPHLCSLVGLEPAAYDLGSRKIAYGLARWSECVRAGVWPAYPPHVHYPEMPPWERERAEGATLGIPYDVAKLWTKPAREDDPA